MGRRSFLLGVCALVVSGWLVAGLESAPAAVGSLQRLLEAELARFPAKTGIFVKHLTTAEQADVRGDETFNSASVIKIPIMVLAYQLADQGKLSLDARVEMRKTDLRGGSGVLRYHDVGLQPTVRDLITQMIITSDNTATDMMLGLVGGVTAVNAWLDANGYRDLRLNSTIFEVFRRRYEAADSAFKSLTPEDLYALQSGDPAHATMSRERFDGVQKAMQRPGLAAELNRQVNEEPSAWLGRITPHGIGRMLEAIETCTIASRQGCTEMTRAFRRQQSGSRRLPHFLDVPVGHKTGDFPPVLANDVGVIYARSGPIVVSFLTNAIREPYAELEDRMGRTTRVIVDFFDGAGAR
jgi:beta-lactamase class A